MSGRPLDALARRGVLLGVRIAERRRRAIAQAVADEIAGVSASVEGEAVVLSGRGLMRRWMADARLRYFGSGGR